jgi:hypothetical protein
VKRLGGPEGKQRTSGQVSDPSAPPLESRRANSSCTGARHTCRTVEQGLSSMHSTHVLMRTRPMPRGRFLFSLSPHLQAAARRQCRGTVRRGRNLNTAVGNLTPHTPTWQLLRPALPLNPAPRAHTPTPTPRARVPTGSQPSLHPAAQGAPPHPTAQTRPGGN